jgi:hypothetical protein
MLLLIELLWNAYVGACSNAIETKANVRINGKLMLAQILVV